MKNTGYHNVVYRIALIKNKMQIKLNDTECKVHF